MPVALHSSGFRLRSCTISIAEPVRISQGISEVMVRLTANRMALGGCNNVDGEIVALDQFPKGSEDEHDDGEKLKPGMVLLA